MLVEKKILKKIKELGLNSYEAKIWTALLSRGVSTAGEISDIANVPRSRSYDVLESLEKKGFIIMKVGKPIQYIAVPPEEVMNRVKKGVLEEAEQKVEMLEEFENSKLLTELKELHSEGIESVDPTEITGFVKGRSNIYDHINMLLKNAEKEVKIVMTEESIRRVADNLTRALNKTQRNNVNILISAPDGAGLEERDHVKVRNTGLKGRFVIVDGSQVLFLITGEDVHSSYDTAVWVESEPLAQLFEQTFDRAWSSVNVQTTVKAEVVKKN